MQKVIILNRQEENCIKSNWLASSQQRGGLSSHCHRRLYNCTRGIFSEGGIDKKGNGGKEWFLMIISAQFSHNFRAKRTRLASMVVFMLNTCLVLSTSSLSRIIMALIVRCPLSLCIVLITYLYITNLLFWVLL